MTLGTVRGMRKVWAWGLVLCVGLAACTSSTAEDPPATTVPSTSTTVGTTVPSTTPTSSTAASTTSSSPTTTAAASSDDGLIGTQEAYDALVDRVLEDVRVFNRDLTAADVPLPDLRLADPVMALEEILTFDTWVFGTVPATSWVDLIYAPDGPYSSRTASQLSTLSALDARHEYGDEPWTLVTAELARPSDVFPSTDLTGELVAGVAVIAFESKQGPYTVVFRETGDIHETRDGFHVRGYAAIVPTLSGWQVFDLVVDDV